MLRLSLRRYWLMIPIATLFAVAWIGISLDRSPHKHNHAASNNQQPNSAINDNTSIFIIVGTWADSHHDAIEALSAIGVFILTFVLTGSTIGLWIVTRTAANAAKQSADVAERTFTELERPYIFVNTPKFIPSAIEGKPPNVQYILKNYGRTPAIVRWLKATAKPASPSNNGPPTWIEIFNGQIILKSGDEREIQPPTQGHFRRPQQSESRP